MTLTHHHDPTDPLFSGPGRSRALCRSIDWRSTSLGAVESWPQSLRTAIRICFESASPMAVWAGPRFTLMHNEGYAPVLGSKYPRAMGRDASEVWAEVWEIIAPDFHQAFEHGVATRHDDAHFRLSRGDGEAEASFTYSLTPIREEDGRVVGVLNVLEETTASLRDAVERYEQQLRLFEGIASTTPDFVYLFDPQGRFRYANRRLLQVWGMELRDIVGKTCLELGYERWHHDLHMAEIAQVCETKHPIKGEVPFKAPLTGIFGVYEYILTPVLGPDGAVQLIAGTARDVTERKRAEEALRASDRRQAFLVRLGDATRPLAEPVSIEEAVIRVLGEHLGASGVLYGEVEDDGTTVRVHVDYRAQGIPSDAGVHQLDSYGRFVAQAMTSGRTLVVEDVQQVPGLTAAERDAYRDKQITAFVAVPLVKEGHLRAFLGVHQESRRPWAHDEVALIEEAAERTWAAVERARTEAQRKTELYAMTRLQEVSSLFFRDGGLGSILAEIVQAAIDVSQADFGCVQMLDDEKSELRILAARNLPDFWVDFWRILKVGQGACGTAAMRRERVIIEDVLESPVFIGTAALDVQRRAGVRAVQSTPLVSRSGKQLGILSTHAKKPGRPDERTLRLIDLLARQAADIMERAQAEDALRTANAALREADRRKNQFLAMLSHELRNPLAPIKNSVHILNRADPGSDRALRAQAVIARQADQLEKLVDDLLDVTRITQSKIQLQRERVDVNELVQHTLDDYRATFEKALVDLDYNPSSSPVFVLGDHHRLAQVVGNLLQNAAKFTPARGRVKVSVYTEAGQAVVQVSDTGVGLPPQLREQVFEPFMQAETSLDRSMGGLGLGLALVKGLVELHGGEVHASSTGVGEGSQFTIRLPLDDASSSLGLRGPAKVSARPHRVLIIDDNVDAAESLRDVLDMDGHEVAVAYDGPEGMEKAREFHPDLVLCDIGLPGMDGYEVARAMRSDKDLKDTFLVALTGYSRPEDLRRAAEAGFERHLVKPPSLDKIALVLAAIPKR